MLENGFKVENKAKESLSLVMEVSLRVNLTAIYLMDKEPLNM